MWHYSGNIQLWCWFIDCVMILIWKSLCHHARQEKDVHSTKTFQVAWSVSHNQFTRCIATSLDLFRSLGYFQSERRLIFAALEIDWEKSDTIWHNKQAYHIKMVGSIHFNRLQSLVHYMKTVGCLVGTGFEIQNIFIESISSFLFVVKWSEQILLRHIEQNRCTMTWNVRNCPLSAVKT